LLTLDVKPFAISVSLPNPNAINNLSLCRVSDKINRSFRNAETLPLKMFFVPDSGYKIRFLADFIALSFCNAKTPPIA
jgi:hypothetical protein